MNTLKPAEAKQKLDSGKYILLDVRTLPEHKKEFIPGSIHIELNDLESNQDKIEKLLDTYEGIIVYCETGGRGGSACSILSSLFPDKIYNLEGGIQGWKASGLGVTKIGMPINAQVRLVAGILVLLGIVLEYAVFPGGIILSILVSLGLIYSGITNNCMMANLLAKMPWNK